MPGGGGRRTTPSRTSRRGVFRASSAIPVLRKVRRRRFLGGHGVVEQFTDVTMLGTAGLTVGGTEVASGTVSLNSTAALSTSGTEVALSSVNLVAVGGLDVEGIRSAFGLATLSAVPGMTVSGTEVGIAIANLSAAASITTSASGVRFGNVDLNAVADLILDDIDAERYGAAALTAIGALQIVASADRMATLALTTAASLSPGEGLVGGQGEVELSVIPHLSVSVDREALSDVLMLAAAELEVGAFAGRFATTLLDTVATLDSEVIGANTASVLMNAVASLNSQAIESLFASAILNCVASISAGTYKEAIVPAVDLSTSGELASGLGGAASGGAVLTALATLLTEGTATDLGAVGLVATGDLDVTSLKLAGASAVFSSDASFDTSGLATRVASAILNTSGVLNSDGTMTAQAAIVLNSFVQFLTSAESGDTGVVNMDAIVNFVTDGLAEMKAATNLSVDSLLVVESDLEKLAAVNLVAEALLSGDGSRATVAPLTLLVAQAELIAELSYALLLLPLAVRGPVLQELFQVTVSNGGYTSRLTNGSGYNVKRS